MRVILAIWALCKMKKLNEIILEIFSTDHCFMICKELRHFLGIGS